MCPILKLEIYLDYNLQLTCSKSLIFVQEAVWLSSKASQMGTVKLHAVVKEDIDNEIEDFREFFKGDIHLDEKV